MNDKFIQIKGPFRKDVDLIPYIRDLFAVDLSHIKKIGIQTKVRNYVKMNDRIFEIGKTGILEFEDTKVTSLSFVQDEAESTLIDCILE